MSAFSRFPRSVTVSLMAALCAFAIDARAVVGIELTSGNSVVKIDPFNPSGMNSWVVDGQNQLYQQWFWYRTASQTREYSIDTIGRRQSCKTRQAKRLRLTLALALP